MKGLMLVLACAIGPADLPHCGTGFDLRVVADGTLDRSTPAFVVLKVNVPKGAVLEVKEQRTGRLLGMVRPFGAEDAASYRFAAPEGSAIGETLLRVDASWPGGTAGADGPPSVCVEEAKLVN